MAFKISSLNLVLASSKVQLGSTSKFNKVPYRLEKREGMYSLCVVVEDGGKVFIVFRDLAGGFFGSFDDVALSGVVTLFMVSRLGDMLPFQWILVAEEL
jgi:hypothetical protein